MSELAKKACIACRGDVPSLKGKEIGIFLKKLGGKWRVVDEHHLEKEFKFKDWAEAMRFSNRVSEIAERENHHPELTVGYGKVTVRIWTHKINGLFESDFILAAKIDESFK